LTDSTDSKKQDQSSEGIATEDIPAILQAIDKIMTYRNRGKEDTMTAQALIEYVDSLLKFGTFAYVTISKLLDYHLKTVSADSTTTQTKDIAQVLERYSSFYS
jgi:hypothetical protein